MSLQRNQQTTHSHGSSIIGARPLLHRKCTRGQYTVHPRNFSVCSGERLSKPLYAKLHVAQASDLYEQEADRVADLVMGSSSGVLSLSEHRHAKSVMQKPISSSQISSSQNSNNDEAPSVVHDVLGSAGSPLDNSIQDFMASRFDYNFSNVRIHTDNKAAISAQAVNAKAYTVGSDIVFDRSNYNPSTYIGRKLLAHELTHVVQSDGGGNRRSGAPEKKTKINNVAENRGVANNPLSVNRSLNTSRLFRQQHNPSVTLTLPTRLTMPSAPQRSSTSRSYDLASFETNSAVLTATHEAILQQLANQLNASPLIFGGFVSIWGFADSRGGDESNRRLGQARADAVRNRLQALVTDPDTRQQIRAMSLGEAINDRQGDVAEFRKVEITVVRRNIDFGLRPSGTLTPPLSPSTPIPSSPRLNLNIGPTIGQGPTSLPPWFSRSVSPLNRRRVDLRSVSDVLTDGIRQPMAQGIAGIADRLAGVVGIDTDRDEIRRSLDNAFISAGEAGLKKLLELMITVIAGEPTAPQIDPFGLPTSNFTAPGERIINSPTFRF